MKLTQENAGKYLGKKLDAVKRVWQYYPLTVGQWENGAFYIKDNCGVCMPVPGEKERFNSVWFDYIIHDEYNGFSLFECVNEPGYFIFGHFETLKYEDAIPANQCGTLEQVAAELTRWKNVIDYDNKEMLAMESQFLATIKKLQEAKQ